jgi:hypothetical protein
MGSSEDIVHDGAKQRAWRAAKLREAIDNQTPSEIMEARTGISVPRFGIDGIDGIDEAASSSSQKKANQSAVNSPSNSAEAAAPQPVFTECDIEALAKAISETVFLLPEQGIVFTKVQLAKELGVTLDAMLSMTDEGYERLGLLQIKPSR